MYEDRVAVGLGTRQILGRNVAVGAGPVLDQHWLARARAYLLGEESHPNVGAAARRERANDVQFARGVGCWHLCGRG